ncbi:hypothetical protein DL93DRAFT_156137 [Clavulina sp. PMI_390]|nr:hypothetical protein DL93DRAFT_156137 [Clavulina sp. PMI_390]
MPAAAKENTHRKSTSRATSKARADADPTVSSGSAVQPSRASKNRGRPPRVPLSPSKRHSNMNGITQEGYGSAGGGSEIMTIPAPKFLSNSAGGSSRKSLAVSQPSQLRSSTPRLYKSKRTGVDSRAQPPPSQGRDEVVADDTSDDQEPQASTSKRRFPAPSTRKNDLASSSSYYRNSFAVILDSDDDTTPHASTSKASSAVRSAKKQGLPNKAVAGFTAFYTVNMKSTLQERILALEDSAADVVTAGYMQRAQAHAAREEYYDNLFFLKVFEELMKEPTNLSLVHSAVEVVEKYEYLREH